MTVITLSREAVQQENFMANLQDIDQPEVVAWLDLAKLAIGGMAYATNFQASAGQIQLITLQSHREAMSLYREPERWRLLAVERHKMNLKKDASLKECVEALEFAQAVIGHPDDEGMAVIAVAITNAKEAMK